MATKTRARGAAWHLAAVLVAVSGGFGPAARARNAADAWQKTLFDAILAGNVGAVKAALRRGANVGETSPLYNSTPLMLAINYKRAGIVKLLLAHGAKLEAEGTLAPLSLAATHGNATIVKLLLAHGAKVDRPDPQDGATPLFDAAAHSLSSAPDKEKAAIVATLLAAGANPNAGERHDGRPALMWAARHKQTAIVQSLIAHGANVNAKDRHGMTPLMHAAVGGSPTVVKLLLAHGADVNTRTSESGRTASDFAREHDHPDLVSLLKQAQAKP